jgi:hypothetical protein
MSEIISEIIAERDGKGRFVNGAKPGPGRPVGARSKLGSLFLEDLKRSWEVHGAEALRRCAVESPDQYVRVVAGLQPRELDVGVNVDVLHDVTTTLEAFRVLSDVLGADPARGMKQLRRLAPNLADE